MNYYLHCHNCIYRIPEVEEEKRQKMEEKQQQLEALDDDK